MPRRNGKKLRGLAGKLARKRGVRNPTSLETKIRRGEKPKKGAS